jgi:hypothetical protein
MTESTKINVCNIVQTNQSLLISDALMKKKTRENIYFYYLKYKTINIKLKMIQIILILIKEYGWIW